MNRQITPHFGKRLNSLIFEKGLEGVAQFARQAGICRSEAYALLTRKTPPAFSRVIMLADFFSCSVDYLLGLVPFDGSAVSSGSRPFGEGLKAVIEQKYSTRYLFCQQLQFSESMVAAWYSGKSLPSSENVIRIAEFLKCSVDSILGRIPLTDLSQT